MENAKNDVRYMHNVDISCNEMVLYAKDIPVLQTTMVSQFILVKIYN